MVTPCHRLLNVQVIGIGPGLSFFVILMRFCPFSAILTFFVILGGIELLEPLQVNYRGDSDSLEWHTECLVSGNGFDRKPA